MDQTNPPTRRRWFQFSIGTMLLLMTLFALWAFKAEQIINAPKPPPRVSIAPADVVQLVTVLKGPAKRAGHIANVRIVAAQRLGDVGPLAKRYGAAKALQDLLAATNDAEEITIAQDALRKISGN